MRKNAILASVSALAALGTSHAAINIYDFNNLSSADLGGQDNWVTTSYITSDDAYISSGQGADGTNAVRFTSGGAGVGVDGSRLNDAQFALPDFGSSDTGYLEFDFIAPYWGGNFGLGYDFDSDGKIEYNSDELAFSLSMANNNDTLAFSNLSDSSSSTSISGLGLSGSWITLRIDFDFSANAGAGTASVSYKDAELEGSEFTTITSMQNLNLGLNPLSGGVDNAANWEGMFFHFEGAVGGLDNVSAVPEPAQFTLLASLCALSMAVLRHRKR